jgi:hypothetical protein
MEHEKAAGLANLVAKYRPTWHIRTITDQIVGLAGANDATIAAYVITTAMDYRNVRAPTMIAVKWNPDKPWTLEADRPNRPGSKEPCDICGRTEWQCNQVIKNKCGDGHTYMPAMPRGYRTIEDSDLLGAIDALGGIGRPV